MHDQNGGGAGQSAPQETGSSGGPNSSERILAGVASPIEFISALFEGIERGQVEYRALIDGEAGVGKPPLYRVWTGPGRGAGEAVMPLVNRANERKVGLFYGVLPRRTKGVGTSEDVVSGRTVWGDLDFKDYEHGETDARGRLDAFGISPSIIIRTGHGLHVLWLLDELCEPQRLSALTKAVGEHLGGDHVHDAARLLRMPGTFNWKDPAHPLPVEIELFEPARRYSVAELEAAVGPIDEPNSGEEFEHEPAPEFDPASAALSERVAGLLASSPRLRDLFHGVGKPPTGRDGQPLDRSGSGYDFSFTVELVKRGVTDATELARALIARPDGHARKNGVAYVQRTVKKVLDSFKPQQTNVLAYLAIDRVVIFDSAPPVYEFTVGGKQFRATAEDLSSPARFGTLYLEATHRLPNIPSKKADWAPWVNALLQGAERVEMPPDASEEQSLREAIERVVAGLAISPEADEVFHGKALELSDGRRAFRPDEIRKLLLDDYPELTRPSLCRTLKALQYESACHRAGDKVIRVWARRATP